MKPCAGVPLLILLLVAMPGCAKMWSREPLDYHTVTIDPGHDAEKAKKENEKALKFIECGKMDKAEQALQRALIADVDFGPAHNNLGKLYFSQTKYYYAAWEFQYAIKAMPDRAEPFNNLGLVYENVGKLNEAIEAYDTAFHMQPTNAEIVGNLARARIRRGDARADVEKLLKDLIYYDTRPQWISWANDNLTFYNKPEPTSPSLERIQTPHGESQAHPSDDIHLPQGDSAPQSPVASEKADTEHITHHQTDGSTTK
jgi:tetratricopeptide (TPR) repeat protein